MVVVHAQPPGALCRGIIAAVCDFPCRRILEVRIETFISHTVYFGYDAGYRFSTSSRGSPAAAEVGFVPKNAERVAAMSTGCTRR